jgi:hypothetical protein
MGSSATSVNSQPGDVPKNGVGQLQRLWGLVYLPAGWPPQQPSSSSTASSMSEAPGQWKQEQRLPRCKKLLLHAS